MGNVVDIISEKGSKLTSSQTFILSLLLVIGFIILPFMSYLENSESTDITAQTATNQVEINNKILGQLQLLNKNIENGNLNHLRYNEAVAAYESRFKASMYELTEMVMVTIAENHIDELNRQIRIREQYTPKINALYRSDKAKLNQLYYNNRPLGEAMVKINPTDVVDGILEIMFDSSLGHRQRISDLVTYLTGNRETFIQIGVSYLDSDATYDSDCYVSNDKQK